MSSALMNLQAAIDRKGDRLFSVLLAETQPRMGTYIALADAIQDANHQAVIVHPEGIALADDELAGFGSVRFCPLPFEEIKLLKGVDLFFSPEVTCDVAPPEAVTVGIIHSIPDAGLQHDRLASNAVWFVEKYPTIIRTLDYLVVAVCQGDEEWTMENYRIVQDVYPAAFLKGRRRHLDIVPGGYPKLDYSRRILGSSAPLRSIIYSPTSQGSAVSKVQHDGESVLSTLLRAFPEMKIVFRPYPSQANMEHGRILAAKFTAYRNFVFDDTATGIAYQKECAVAVTDSSSSALTFSFATGRPLVFVNLKEGAETKLQGTPLGFRTETPEGLIEGVRRGIRDAAQWAVTIREEARKNIYHPGSAAGYLAANLNRFANRASHPDWLSIERRPWIATGRDGEVARHLGHLRAWSRRAGPRAAKVYEEIDRFFFNEYPQNNNAASRVAPHYGKSTK